MTSPRLARRGPVGRHLVASARPWRRGPVQRAGPRMGPTPETCRRSADYGLTMDRMRHLDSPDGERQPIYRISP